MPAEVQQRFGQPVSEVALADYALAVHKPVCRGRHPSIRQADAPGLVVAGAGGSTEAVSLPVRGRGTYVVFAHFCDSRARASSAGQTADYPNPVVTAPGEVAFWANAAAGSANRNRTESWILDRIPGSYPNRAGEIKWLATQGPFAVW